MKITIDTKTDSKKDIKQVIAFLEQYISNNGDNNYSTNTSELPVAGAFNIFGNDSETNNVKNQENDYPIKKDDSDDEPRVQIIDF